MTALFAQMARLWREWRSPYDDTRDLMRQIHQTWER